MMSTSTTTTTTTTTDTRAFQGFTEELVPVHSSVLNQEIQIYTKRKGIGKRGILLLHGYPQTHHIWHKIAPRLAQNEEYTVVISDLRGYGQSSKPPGSENHDVYSKREMAADQVQVMRHFGFDTFTIIGHDRGARVAHRLALDHPSVVKGMMLLDIAPTLYMYDRTDMAFAKGYWHWFFLIQDAPGPEDVMLADPEKFWALMAGRPSHKGVEWSAQDLKIYKDALFTKETVHATCEDYRAAATIDLEHDRTSREAGERIKIPRLVVLWGQKGMIESYNFGDVVGLWREWIDPPTTIGGRGLDGGHYLPEEKSEDVFGEIVALLEATS